MAIQNLAGGATGNSGALTADTMFAVESGKVDLSTDAGTTYVAFDAGEKVIVPSGRTVHWRNGMPTPAILKYMDF